MTKRPANSTLVPADELEDYIWGVAYEQARRLPRFARTPAFLGGDAYPHLCPEALPPPPPEPTP